MNKICIDFPILAILVVGIFMFYKYQLDKNENKNCPICPKGNKKVIYQKIYEKNRAPTKYISSLLPNSLKAYPTQGLPSYQQIGNIAGEHNGVNKVFQLFGRPKHHRSNQWLYYAEHPDENLKFDIEVVNDEELYDEDIVSLREFPNHEFKVYLHQKIPEHLLYKPYL